MQFLCFPNKRKSNLNTVRNYFSICFLFFISSCSIKEKDASVVLARVEDDVLTINRLNNSLSSQKKVDGLVKSYIHDWVNNSLLFKEAKEEGFTKDKNLLEKRDLYFKKLVIGSYIESKTLSKTNISKQDIREYYANNKESFIRSSPSASVYHFITDNHAEARSIKKLLLKKKSGESMDELFKQHNVELKTVYKNRLIDKLDLALFDRKEGPIIGPIKTSKGYHVLEVLNRFEKGSQLGLEEVYDEIYQRMLKKNQLSLLNGLIDSLKSKTNVFINASYE